MHFRLLKHTICGTTKNVFGCNIIETAKITHTSLYPIACEEYCAPKYLSFIGGAFGIMHQKTDIKDKSPLKETKVEKNIGPWLIKKTKVKGL